MVAAAGATTTRKKVATRAAVAPPPLRAIDKRDCRRGATSGGSSALPGAPSSWKRFGAFSACQCPGANLGPSFALSRKA
jgi:hypothetical protein